MIGGRAFGKQRVECLLERLIGDGIGAFVGEDDDIGRSKSGIEGPQADGLGRDNRAIEIGKRVLRRSRVHRRDAADADRKALLRHIPSSLLARSPSQYAAASCPAAPGREGSATTE